LKTSKSINLIDVTLREGNYTIDFSLTPDQSADIYDYLSSAGVEHIEVNAGSFKPSLQADLQLIEHIRNRSSKSKLGVMVTSMSAVCASLYEFDELCKHVDFVRIGTNADDVESSARWIEIAKKHSLLTFFQLVRSPAFSPSKVARSAKKAVKYGADVLYLVDTMGSFTPEKVKEYVKAIKGECKKDLGFHGHNNLGLAISNSLEAVKSGCKWIDASMLGVGRQAGNTQLEIIALLLKREGYKVNFNIPLLLATAESLIAPIFKNHKGIDPYDVWAAFWNLDLYPRWFFEKVGLLIGMDYISFAEELAKLKNFVMLDESRLAELCKKFNVPYDKMLNAIQSPPEQIQAPK